MAAAPGGVQSQAAPLVPALSPGHTGLWGAYSQPPSLTCSRQLIPEAEPRGPAGVFLLVSDQMPSSFPEHVPRSRVPARVAGGEYLGCRRSLSGRKKARQHRPPHFLG